MIVHPGAGTGEDTLVHALLAHCKGGLSGVGGVERPGIVHRLDRETSGIILVAKTDKAHRGPGGSNFPNARTAEGISRAGRRCAGADEAGRSRRRLAATSSTGTRWRRWTQSRAAATHTPTGEVVERFGPVATLVRCTIHTGRTSPDPRPPEVAGPHPAGR